MNSQKFPCVGVRAVGALFAAFLVVMAASSTALGVAQRRFEIATFLTPGTPDHHFNQAQFDHLNKVTSNGKFLAMGSDVHRAEINGQGNFLCIYYDTLNDGYGTMTATQKADAIQAYAVSNFSASGVVPTWIILNELSAGTWPGSAAYRTWVNAVIARLDVTYNHEVIVCSPFDAPLNNAADWQALSAHAYIAVEKYLSGKDINASGNSVAWCQAQYQDAKNHYLNLGVPAAKIYLVEHFAQTTADINRGRQGVSYAGWDNAIKARATAAQNVGFAGFVSFAWAFNQMVVPDADLTHFEDTYCAKSLP